jgi:DNA/RNA endonuclease G (NUC1)
MPNDQSVGDDWTKYRVSVRDVEKMTGHTFFRRVDADVAAEIKRDADTVKVMLPKSKAKTP